MENDKDLGIVIGQLRYLTDELHEVKRDVKMLVGWRRSLLGAAAVISIAGSGLMLIIFGR